MENTDFTNRSTPSASEVTPKTDGLTRASSSAQSAINSVADSADAAARKAQPAVERVAAMAHQAVDQPAGSAAPALDWLGQQGESLNATQKKLVSNSSAYISANPLVSVGVAVVAGFILSRMIRS